MTTRITDIKVILTAPEGINLVAVKVETDQPGLVGLGCATFAYRHVAVKCLIGVVFLGAAMCVRMSRHIQVDVLYHYLPAGLTRIMATLVDIIRTLFFGSSCHADV